MQRGKNSIVAHGFLHLPLRTLFSLPSFTFERPTTIGKQNSPKIAEERAMIAFGVRVICHCSVEVLGARDVYTNPFFPFALGPDSSCEYDCLTASENSNIAWLH